MTSNRTYQSALREAQANKTREQILAGLVRTMASGITEISIPAVAKEAGVSVPTVYRYFPTKRALVEALGGYLAAKAGLGQVVARPPSSPEELAALARRMHEASEGLDDVLRAAAASELGRELRKDAIPMRIKTIAHALAPVRDRFDEAEWSHLCNVVLVLASSATIRAFKDYLQLPGKDSGDAVAWAIETLCRGSANKTQPPQGTKARRGRAEGRDGHDARDAMGTYSREPGPRRSGARGR